MAPKKLIKDVGEDALIKRIAKILPTPPGVAPGVTVGIGDDAAVTKHSAGRDLLSSTDILVEGVHFTDGTPPYLLGKKAVSVSVSDIAAMGGAPKHLLVSIAINGELPASMVDWLYRGIRDACSSYGVSAVGGNTSASPGPTVISTTVIGEIETGGAVLRSGGGVGDIIYVTGTIGDAALGLKLLQDGYDTRRGPYPGPITRHLDPVARVSAGRLLAQAATSMMDLSDGLWIDLGRLTGSSGVGAVVDTLKLPLSEEFTRWVKEGGDAAVAITGGEDYELLFTAPPGGETERVVEAATKEEGLPVTAIGEVRSREEGLKLLGSDGEKTAPTGGGFSHF